jgi:hypothetical protein
MAELVADVKARIAFEANISEELIDVRKPLVTLGIGSMELVQIRGMLDVRRAHGRRARAAAGEAWTRRGAARRAAHARPPPCALPGRAVCVLTAPRRRCTSSTLRRACWPPTRRPSKRSQRPSRCAHSERTRARAHACLRAGDPHARPHRSARLFPRSFDSLVHPLNHSHVIVRVLAWAQAGKIPDSMAKATVILQADAADADPAVTQHSRPHKRAGPPCCVVQ